MLTWAHERGVKLFLIEPGKPNQNAYIELFNGRAGNQDRLPVQNSKDYVLAAAVEPASAS
ncbi:hypothetical protein NNRS527_01676 [Nitrosospira sp. NRS527]|nr:hypothetical protein NNRS527_01676 [Nitrosospira sp. NRS527]